MCRCSDVAGRLRDTSLARPRHTTQRPHTQNHPMCMCARTQVQDARAVAAAAEAQRLMLRWSAHDVHFLPIVYEQLNDLLLGAMCPAA